MESLISLNQDAIIIHANVWITNHRICIKPNKWISKRRISESAIKSIPGGWIMCKNYMGSRMALYPGNNYEFGESKSR